jgi:hypothetical protein
VSLRSLSVQCGDICNKVLGQKLLFWLSFVISSVLPGKCWHNIFQNLIHYEHSNDNTTHAIVISSICYSKTDHYPVVICDVEISLHVPNLWRNLFENSTHGFQKMSRSALTAIILRFMYGRYEWKWSWRCNKQMDYAITKIIIKKLRGLVRQRTIPTERPPLVGEVSANFNG